MWRSWFIAAPGFAAFYPRAGGSENELMANDYQLCGFSSYLRLGFICDRAGDFMGIEGR